MSDGKHANQKSRPADCPPVGSFWKHYKGDTYQVTHLGVDEKTGEIMVGYQSAVGLASGWLPWERPLHEGDNAFLGAVSEDDLRKAGFAVYPRGLVVIRFTRLSDTVTCWRCEGKHRCLGCEPGFCEFPCMVCHCRGTIKRTL